MTYFDELFFHSPHDSLIDESLEVWSLHFRRFGQVLWFVDEDVRALPAPVAWWTLPGQPLDFGASTSDEDDFQITFGGPRAQKMQSGGLIPDGFQQFVLLHEAEAFERLFEELLALVEHQTSPRAVWLLEGLWLLLREVPNPPALSPLEQAVSDWLNAVKSAPERDWNLNEVAASLAISPTHLRRMTRKLVGVSPLRWVLERRLDAAARRLRTSREPIKSLAPACGFRDVNGFGRAFAARYHLPPAAYRRANRVVTLESARMKRRQTLRESFVDSPQ